MGRKWEVCGEGVGSVWGGSVECVGRECRVWGEGVCVGGMSVRRHCGECGESVERECVGRHHVRRQW